MDLLVGVVDVEMDFNDRLANKFTGSASKEKNPDTIKKQPAPVPSEAVTRMQTFDNRTYTSSRTQASDKVSEEQQTDKDKKSVVVKDSAGEKTTYTYNAQKIVGNGTFGVVFQATIKETGETVAIKKVFQDKRYRNREAQILKELNHPNVTIMRGSFFTHGDKPDEVYLNVVMDYIPETIYKIIKYYRKMKQSMPTVLIKLYSYQLFRSLAYIRVLGICHRDIKPQNVLVDPASHHLKLCDFGSAKRLVKGEPNIAYICSRYYRAPELIFGATEYGFEIDMWSTGCVIAEMMLGEPLFPGDSGLDQLVEIIKVLGTPTNEQVLKMNPTCEEFKFPQIKTQPWTKVFKKADPAVIDLLAKVMVYDPKERLTPTEALLHPFFNDLRNQNFQIPGCKVSDLFNFTSEELSAAGSLASQLTPSWYKKSTE